MREPVNEHDRINLTTQEAVFHLIDEALAGYRKFKEVAGDDQFEGLTVAETEFAVVLSFVTSAMCQGLGVKLLNGAIRSEFLEQALIHAINNTVRDVVRISEEAEATKQ